MLDAIFNIIIARRVYETLRILIDQMQCFWPSCQNSADIFILSSYQVLITQCNVVRLFVRTLPLISYVRINSPNAML